MHCSTLVAVLLLAGCVCSDAGVLTPAAEVPTALVPAAETTAVAADRSAADWASVLGCMFGDNVGVCLQQRTMRAMKKWLESERQKTEEMTALAKGGDDDDEDVTPDKKKGIMDQIGDIFSFGMSRFLQFVDDDDDDDKQDDDDDDEDDEEKQEDDKEEEEEEEEEGRSLAEGRKKKKKRKKPLKKLKALVIALLVLKFLKEKKYLILAKLGFLLTVKLLVVAKLNLLVNSGRLFFAWKKHKIPAKAIHLEHVNHQHHYEHEHLNDDLHYADEEKPKKKEGWFGRLFRGWDGWKNSIKHKRVVPHQGYVQTVQTYPAVHEAPLTAVHYQPEYTQQQIYGQNLAYAAQKPEYRANDDEEEEEYEK